MLKIKTLAKMSALTVRRENTLVKNNKKKTKAAYATPKKSRVLTHIANVLAEMFTLEEKEEGEGNQGCS